MNKVTVEQAINSGTLRPGMNVYVSGNAATPQTLLKQLAKDEEIEDIAVYGVLLLGDIGELFTEKNLHRITHRVIFNSHHTRHAVNAGLAKYQPMHLSDIPSQLLNHIQIDAVLLTVSGPDQGGNFSLGTTVEGVMAAIESAKKHGGVIIAEKNAKMPFVLGTTIPASAIDYLVETDVPLPPSPVKKPDARAAKIAELITDNYIKPGSTLQFGIGEVPEAVADAIIERRIKNLGVHTELFADAMRRLVDHGLVSNRFTAVRNNFSVATLFLSTTQEGYEWYHMNSSVQSRSADFTNSINRIARQPNMVAVNSAIGIDIHGNIWADSMDPRHVYSGVGGQADFLRGAYISPGGVPIIALKSTTDKGLSKILMNSPAGITTTAVACDPVVMVTEHGIFDPRGCSLAERAVGIAHLSDPATRELLLKEVIDNSGHHRPHELLRGGRPKGFCPA